MLRIRWLLAGGYTLTALFIVVYGAVLGWHLDMSLLAGAGAGVCFVVGSLPFLVINRKRLAQMGYRW